jgi:hypothetical protein
MKTALLMMIFIAAASPVLANPYRSYHSGRAAWGESSYIDCETVRVYVAQLGGEHAKALRRRDDRIARMEGKAVPCDEGLTDKRFHLMAGSLLHQA